MSDLLFVAMLNFISINVNFKNFTQTHCMHYTQPQKYQNIKAKHRNFEAYEVSESTKNYFF